MQVTKRSLKVELVRETGNLLCEELAEDFLNHELRCLSISTRPNADIIFLLLLDQQIECDFVQTWSLKDSIVSIDKSGCRLPVLPRVDSLSLEL